MAISPQKAKYKVKDDENVESVHQVVGRTIDAYWSQVQVFVGKHACSGTDCPSQLLMLFIITLASDLYSD